jgi:uncharacterized protein YqeY
MKERLETTIKNVLTKTLKEDSKNSVAIETYKAILSELTYLQKKIGIDKQYSEDDELAILKKLAKQRNESMLMFKEGKRMDLYVREEAQLEVLKKYLPAERSTEEINSVIDSEMVELKGSLQEEITQKHFGKIMSMVMSKLKGTDGKIVSDLIKQKFNK